MKKKPLKRVLLGLSGLFFLSAVILTIVQLNAPREQLCIFPEGIRIGSVEVEGLTPEIAKEKVRLHYNTPATVRIEDSSLQISPADLGIRYDIEETVDTAAKPCAPSAGMAAGWAALWNQPASGFESVTVTAFVDEASIQSYVESQILPRYGQAGSQAYAIPGTTEFLRAEPGAAIDGDTLVKELSAVFRTTGERVITLQSNVTAAVWPDSEQIEFLLRDNIQRYGLDGVVEVFLRDLTTGEDIHFALQGGNAVTPDIAFTAASTMKIPIMISSLWRSAFPPDEMVSGWLNYMIILSENDPADRLMERIDAVSGPLQVTNDMRRLGLENTFIAGYFYMGAPLLDMITTPANTRTDIDLNPDLYNQTTPSDIGNLLADLYECAQTNSGDLVRISENNLDSQKCQFMIDILSRNQIGALIEAGVPEGAPVAHKHGWSEESDGYLHTVSDVGIVYGPQKDFVMVVFVHTQRQLLFEVANFLVAQLAQTAYNGMNPDHQIPWVFGE